MPPGLPKGAPWQVLASLDVFPPTETSKNAGPLLGPSFDNSPTPHLPRRRTLWKCNIFLT